MPRTELAMPNPEGENGGASYRTKAFRPTGMQAYDWQASRIERQASLTEVNSKLQGHTPQPWDSPHRSPGYEYHPSVTGERHGARVYSDMPTNRMF